MAPEQLRGERCDARSDIWAAGAVLYEMATGRRPFPQPQTAELIGAILHQGVEPPSTHNRHITPTLERVVMKALEKKPEKRYQSAGELRVALDGVTAGIEPIANRRLHWAAAAAGAIGLSIVFLIGLTLGLNLGGWRDRLLGKKQFQQRERAHKSTPVSGGAWFQESLGT